MTQTNNGNRPATISSPPTSAVSPDRWEDPRVVQALEEYRSAQDRNEVPDRREFLERYADVALELGACLDALDFVRNTARNFTSSAIEHRDPTQPSEAALQPGILGDYQIVCEIGRGGMGVVYEAQQISLGRRVALKVLPFAAMLDPRQLTRFKNEAQAAATLDHPNIVSVYAIGCDRSVHYFAMQYVAGQTLAEVIRDLRQRDGLADADDRDSATISYVLTGEPEPKTPAAEPHPAPASAPTVRAPQAAISTQRATDSKAYFQNIARLGIQAAEALDHAHQHGILHRDVKPGNLMLDATGKLWVTDFGLARMLGDAGMTMTGDLVGTLRYMSPEQALAKRVVVDHRSDIYSLGVTLYELLTLRPAFASDDRQELLRAIAFDEPAPPRTWNRAIPAELETIVLKAMAKDPRERYATAQEMADDLNRFLSDQPIRARRPSFVNLARKWSRRHRAVVTATGLVALVALVVGAGLLWRERSLTLAALAEARHEREVAQLQREVAQNEREVARANFRQSQQAVDDYLTKVSQTKLLDKPGMEPLRKELLESAVQYYQDFVAEHADDPELKSELAAAHWRLAHIYDQMGSNQWIDELEHAVEIVELLVDQGADVSQWRSLREGVAFTEYRGSRLTDQEDSRRALLVCNRAIPVWEKLTKRYPDVPGFACDLAGLYFIRATRLPLTEAKSSYEQAVAIWEQFPHKINGTSRQSMLGLALTQLAKHYQTQGDLGQASRKIERAMQALSGSELPNELASLQRGYLRSAAVLMAEIRLELEAKQSPSSIGVEYMATHPALAAEGLYWRGIQKYSNRSEAAKIFQRALYFLEPLLKSEPDNEEHADLAIMIYGHYGEILASEGRSKEAQSIWKKAIPLRPLTGGGFESHGKASEGLGDSQQALADFRRAVELEPDSNPFARSLLDHLRSHGRYQEAITLMGRTIKRDKDNPVNYWMRADLYGSLGRYEDQISDMSRAIELDPKDSASFNNRSTAYANIGNHAAALADMTKAIELKPESALYYYNRAVDLWRLHRRQEALTDTKKALELDPNFWEAHAWRSRILLDMLRSDEALEEINAALQETPEASTLSRARSHIYARLEKYPEALADMDSAVQHAPGGRESCQLHVLRGRLKRRMGMTAEAEADFKLACEQADGGPWLAHAKGELGRYKEALDHAPVINETRITLRLATKDYQAALDELVAAEKETPEWGPLHGLHGLVLAESGRYDEAATELSHAIELAPYRVEDWYRRGWIASVQGRYDDARNDFEEAVKIDEFDPLALRRLAWFLATCPDEKYRDAARAVTLAEKATSIHPHNGLFWYTLGVAQYRAGQYDEAFKACQRGLDLRDKPYSPLEEPRFATDFDHDAGFFLAMSQWQLGEKAKARESFDVAVTWMQEHAPDDPQLARFKQEASELLGTETSPQVGEPETATREQSSEEDRSRSKQ